MAEAEGTMQKSVEILQSLQDCYRFEQDRKNRGRIRLVYNMGEGRTPVSKYFGAEDFFKAVDYYYDNRDAEFIVNDAMTRPDGVVNVYAPFSEGQDERPVVLQIKNYLVPQILEFAYLLIRQNQRRKTRVNRFSNP